MFTLSSFSCIGLFLMANIGAVGGASFYSSKENIIIITYRFACIEINYHFTLSAFCVPIPTHSVRRNNIHFHKSKKKTVTLFNIGPNQYAGSMHVNVDYASTFLFIYSPSIVIRIYMLFWSTGIFSKWLYFPLNFASRLASIFLAMSHESIILFPFSFVFFFVGDILGFYVKLGAMCVFMTRMKTIEKKNDAKGLQSMARPKSPKEKCYR